MVPEFPVHWEKQFHLIENPNSIGLNNWSMQATGPKLVSGDALPGRSSFEDIGTRHPASCLGSRL